MLSGLLRRPAAYLRAYFTASVEHQLQMQATRATDLWGAAGRLERRTDHLMAQASAQAEREGALSVRLDHVSAHTGLIAGEVEQVCAAVEQVSARIGQVSAKVEHLATRGEQIAAQGEHIAAQGGQVSLQVERVAAKVEHLTAQGEQIAAQGAQVSLQVEHVAAHLDHVTTHLEGVAGALARVVERLAEVERRQDRLAVAVGGVSAQGIESAAVGSDQVALARRIAAAGDHAVARLDQVLGVLGPRFDELEIKIRPLIEVDAQSTAVRTADGYVMLPRSEPLFVTAVANATSGGLEPGTRRVLRALLRPGDACADVGANVGLLTVAMAFAVGPSGRVWAFEPEARVREQLERTLHLNGLRQVVLSRAAVGLQAGRLTFNQSPVIGHSSLYPLPDDEQAQARPVEVEVVRLDDVVVPGTALAAVKIDVEGAELDVLRGMTRVAADSPDMAVVAEFGPSHLARVGVSPAAWFAAFADLGLEPRLIAEPSGLVSPVTAADLAGVESANLVFVRPGGPADGRLPR